MRVALMSLLIPLAVGCGGDESTVDAAAKVEALTGLSGAIDACIQLLEADLDWKVRCGMEVDEGEDHEAACATSYSESDYSECYPEMIALNLCLADYLWDTTDCGPVGYLEACSWDQWRECVE